MRDRDQIRAKKLEVKFPIGPRVEATSPRAGSRCCRNFLVSLEDTQNIGACGVFPWAEERPAVDS